MTPETPIQASIRKANRIAVAATIVALCSLGATVFSVASFDARAASAIEQDTLGAAKTALFQAETVEHNFTVYYSTTPDALTALVLARENLESAVTYYETGDRVAVERRIDRVYAASDAVVRAAEERLDSAAPGFNDRVKAAVRLAAVERAEEYIASSQEYIGNSPAGVDTTTLASAMSLLESLTISPDIGAHSIDAQTDKVNDEIIAVTEASSLLR